MTYGEDPQMHRLARPIDLLCGASMYEHAVRTGRREDAANLYHWLAACRMLRRVEAQRGGECS